MCENKANGVFSIFHDSWKIKRMPDIEEKLPSVTPIASKVFTSHNGNYKWTLTMESRYKGRYFIKVSCKKLTNIFHVKNIEIMIPIGSYFRGKHVISENDCIEFYLTEEIIKYLTFSSDLVIEIRIFEKPENCQISCDIDSTDKLISDYEKLLISGDKSDFKIIIGEKVFCVHKNILCARSDYFSGMFNNETKERADKEVKVTNVRYEVMSEILQYIYCAKFNYTENLVYDLLTAADMYQIIELKRKCEKSIIENLKTNNVGQCMQYADEYDNKCLKIAASNFIVHKYRLIKMKFGTGFTPFNK